MNKNSNEEMLKQLYSKIESVEKTTLEVEAVAERLVVETENIKNFVNIDSSILEHGRTLSSGLDDNFSGLVSVVGTVPDGSYWLAMVSGVVGAIVAACATTAFNHIYSKYMNKKNKINYLSKITIEHLTKFEDSVERYWTEAKNDRNISAMERLETKINTQFHSVRHTSNTLVDSLDGKTKDKDEIVNLIEAIYDYATGETFEQRNRDVNKKVAIRTLRKCSDLKTILYRYSYWSV